MECRKGEHGVSVRVEAWGAADANDVEAELAAGLGCGAAHVAKADDEQGLAGDRGGEDRRPAVLALLGGQRGHTHGEHEQGHLGELGGLRDVDAAVVGERDGGGQPVERDERLDAGADHVDPAQGGCVGELGAEAGVAEHVVGGDEGSGGREPGEVRGVVADGEGDVGWGAGAGGGVGDQGGGDAEDDGFRAAGLEVEAHQGSLEWMAGGMVMISPSRA